MTIVTNDYQGSNETIEKLQGFIEAAMKAVTAEMVNDITVKVVTMMEIADDIVQPETINLMKKLPEVSHSLEKTLDMLKVIEGNGTLETLFQITELIGTIKNSMTGPMITDMVEKGIHGIELADDLIQQDALNIVNGMVSAFYKAQTECQDKEPLTLLQMVRAISDRQTREGISLLLSFVKNLPDKLNKREVG